MPVGGRGPQLLGTVGLFLALTTITIGLRIYCRLAIVKDFGLDDWFAVLAYILFLFYCTFVILGVHHGTGQHADAISTEDFPIAMKWWWSCEPLYILTCMALKLSIGIFLLRLAVTITYKTIIWIVIVVTELFSTYFFFLFIFQCRPSNYFWNQYTLEDYGAGTCIDPMITVNSFYAYSAISCVADWTLGLLPIFLVWNLQMNTRTKLSVGAILAVGAIASTATIVRIPFIKGMNDTADFLYATFDVAIWSTVEPGIGITASACATLRPLFRVYFASSFHSTNGPTTGAGASGRWPKSNTGYVRSAGSEGFALRNDIGKTGGITTVIERDTERGLASVESRDGAEGRWNDSESKLRGSSDREDSGWGGGIMKTTGTTQVVAA